MAESPGGSLAAFPPPHRYFFARDLTDNLGYVWHGSGHRGLEPRAGFGRIRQSETGGGSYAPWFNAPPGTEQHLQVFFLISDGEAGVAAQQVRRFTHDDRFPDLPGHKKFTSHWHMALAVAAQGEIARGEARSKAVPAIFRRLGVDVVHLAEFHGDGHPADPGPVRLAEMKAMFDECRRLSEEGVLFLPGEEANVHLNLDRPGTNTGHWLYLFPRPVYWTMRRAPGQPFREEGTEFGTVYHVGGRADMVRLLEEEHGLAWTAHPRIKASSWAPDIYKDEDFFRAPFWLGAAWKAMPTDLSSPKLGTRSLDLLDDMSNWGARKQLLGEVDVFKIDPTNELYGHMNVNYVRMDRTPRFDADWSPLLAALGAGEFFVSTGEVLLHEATFGGWPSGKTIEAADAVEVRLEVEGTFPLAFAEILSGDGSKVERTRIDLSDSGAFDRRLVSRKVDLRGKTWVRAEVWDIAGDGAFTQPVWVGKAGGR